jgi:hypothetical protein
MKMPPLWFLQVAERFTSLTRFVEDMEAHIRQRLKEQEQNVAAAKSDEQNDIEAMSLDVMQETYPRQLRYGAIFTVYAEVEAVLIDICEAVRRRQKVPFSVHDIGGYGYSRYDTYLKRTVGVFVVDGKQRKRTYWKELQNIATVRHCIAHVAGHVPSVKNPNKLKTALRDLGLGMSGDYILVPDDAPLRLIDYASGWVGALLGEVSGVLTARREAEDIRERLRAWVKPPFAFEERSQSDRLIFGVSGPRSMLLTAQPSIYNDGDFYISAAMCEGPLPRASRRGEEQPSTLDRYSFCWDKPGIGWRAMNGDRKFFSTGGLLDHYIEKMMA